MAEISDFDVTDANNTGRWPENMQFRSVNNAGRADEGLLARWFKDTNCSLTATGAANAYAVTANRTLGAYADNLIIGFTANHTNTGAATLNVSGLGAVTIKRADGTDVLAGDIVNGQKVLVIYKSTGTVFQMLSPSGTDVAYSLTSTQTIAAAATLQILNRTENDTTEREVHSYRSGTGAGNKGSLLVVGDAANAVASMRRKIGAVEIDRWSATQYLMNIAFAIGSNINDAPAGYRDWTEIAAPAAPAADTARMYCKDVTGSTVMFFQDSAGVETPLGGLAAASQAEQETGTATDKVVTPGRQHFHPLHPKCWLYATVSAGTPSIAASHNILSITDTDTGRLTVTIDVDFSSANWAPVAGGSQPVGSIRNIMATAIAAGSVELRCTQVSEAQADPEGWTFAGFGDQT